MNRLCHAALALLLIGSLAQAAERGLVAGHTCDEEGGDLARDSSGHGLDGRITGATRVPSPRGSEPACGGQKAM